MFQMREILNSLSRVDGFLETPIDEDARTHLLYSRDNLMVSFFYSYLES